MALINYVEPIEIGNIFIGLGAMTLSLVIAYIFYRLYIKLIQFIDVIVHKEIKYAIIEEETLSNIAKKKGIDLDKELIKREVFKKKEKNFRKKVEEQVYEEMFGKEQTK